MSPRHLAAVLAALALAVTACGSGAAGGTSGPRAAVDRAAEDLPHLARVVCDDRGTRLLTPAVQPQRDGVHLRVENRTGEDVAFTFEGVGGEDAPTTTGTLVWPLPPGPIRIGCQRATDDPGDLSSLPRLRVADPAGLWHAPSDSSCNGFSSLTVDLAPDASGDPRPPADQARERWANDMEGGDRIDHAGYPDVAEPGVRLVRDGRVLVSARYTRVEGGWILTEETRCEDPPPGVPSTDPDHVVCADVAVDGSVDACDDPEGARPPIRLGCPAAGKRTAVDFGGTATGDAAPPAAQARSLWADRMQPGDRVDDAGGGRDLRLVQLLRDGRPVATALFRRAPGGWVLAQEARCHG